MAAKTIIEVGKILGMSSSVILSTHHMPDGDGLGAEIALYHYLKRLGKDVRIINPDAMPPRYGFLDSSGVVETLETLKNPIEKVDLVVVVDTGDYRRLKNLWHVLEKQTKQIVFLDHHPRLPDEHPSKAPRHGKGPVYDAIDERSSSIGELLYRMFTLAHDYLDPHASSFSLTPEIAQGLYVSILTDTNSFRYARTTALSHRIAAELIEYGLQPEEIYQNIYSSKATDHLRLIGEILSAVQEIEQGCVAWVEIPKKLRKKYNASGDDTQTIVNFLLLLKAAQVLLLFREEDDGRIKVSIKSKGQVVVNTIAAEFGGGGHAYAAGCVVAGAMADVRSKIVQRVQEVLRRSIIRET